jgi:vacuolar-type H+-ATPase subunit I/STV1
MFGRPSLSRLIASQHEEVMAALEQMDEASKRRHEEWQAHNERRAEEWRAYNERREEEGRADLTRREEEMREFNREILLRNEKVYTNVLVQLEEGREQLRANTQAVLSVLDRLDRRDAA